MGPACVFGANLIDGVPCVNKFLKWGTHCHKWDLWGYKLEFTTNSIMLRSEIPLLLQNSSSNTPTQIRYKNSLDERRYRGKDEESR